MPGELALAPLGSNPFPDATPQFYDAFAGVVSTAVGGRVRVLRPYADLHKRDATGDRVRRDPHGLLELLLSATSA